MNDSPLAILSDASGNLITTIADGTARRLQVDARSARPTGASLICKYLLNGTSSSMMVNGSAASPIKFSFTATAPATLTGMTMVATAGTINMAGSAKWLNGSALPNGLVSGLTISSVTNNMTTLKSNEDWVLMSTSATLQNGMAGGLLVAGTNSILIWGIAFSQQLAVGDSAFISVQDNITAANTGNNLINLQSTITGFYNT